MPTSYSSNPLAAWPALSDDRSLLRVGPVAVLASASPGFLASPASSTFATHRDHKAFTQGTPSSALAATAMVAAGGSQPHENMPPYLCVSFIISLYGIFPSQT